MFDRELSAIVQVYVTTLAGMPCTTLLVNKGGIRRLMEVNNNRY